MSHDNPIRVLLIDDEEDSFVLSRALLSRSKRASYRLDWASDYQSGLAFVRQAVHDAYLVDYRLAGQTGVELIREAMAQGSVGPFIVLTNEADHNVDIDALQAGASDYLNKGLLNEEMLERSLVYAVERCRRTTAESMLVKTSHELHAAHAILQRMLPRSTPQIAGLDIAGTCRPADDVGGDFYDYLVGSGDAVTIVLGDASGHGLGPALVISEIRRLVRTLVQTGYRLTEILKLADVAIAEDLDTGFVTIGIVRIDVRSQSLVYLGAGHSGYLLNASGSITRLDSNDPPLGMFPSGDEIATPPMPFRTGDLFLLFSDGLNETHNPAMELFGTRRVLDLLQANRTCSAAEIVELLLRSTEQFRRSPVLQDDITVVVVKCL